MAFSFDATVGTSTANSLCTVEFADDHLGGELYATAWTALANSTPADLLKKQQALVKATRRLERFEYQGVRTNVTTQRLKHPRYGLVKDSGDYYDSATVVEQMRMATAELALHYLSNDPAAVVDDSLKQFKHLRIAGAIELEMRDRLPDAEDIPANVMSLITPFIEYSGTQVRLVRA